MFWCVNMTDFTKERTPHVEIMLDELNLPRESFATYPVELVFEKILEGLLCIEADIENLHQRLIRLEDILQP